MNMIDQQVCHDRFGLGQVTEQTDTAITVCFGEEVKKFLYPAAFAGYLTLVDPALKGQLGKELLLLQEREQQRVDEARRREEAEAQRKKEELLGRLQQKRSRGRAERTVRRAPVVELDDYLESDDEE